MRQLDGPVRGALRGLESRNAEVVAQHLVAAGGLLDDDPDAALAHAQAARERASRIAVVREAVGVAAYHAGDFAEAARELKAYRRMSGDDSYRAVLADCERALGKPDAALRLVAEAVAAGADADETVELRLVEAGARQDLDELPAAALVLESALGGRPTPDQLRAGDLGQLRLATAYADLLVVRGEHDLAQDWFAAVMAADPEDETGVAERFDGIEFDEDDLEDDDAPDDDAPDAGSDDAAPDDAGSDDAAPGGGKDDTREDATAEAAGAAVDPGAGLTAGLGDLAGEGIGDDPDVGPGYDPDEQDVEDEVAELLGEIPVPGFSDGQAAEPAAPIQPRPLPADRAGLFSAPDQAADGDDAEHGTPTV